MDEKRILICNELNAIFSYMDDRKVSKIPKRILKSVEYVVKKYPVEVKVDNSVSLLQNSFDEDTLNILTWLYCKFIIEDERILKVNFDEDNKEEGKKGLSLEELISLYNEEQKNKLPVVKKKWRFF